MSLALLFLHLMLNMFRMLMHPSSGACELCAEFFRGLYWSQPNHNVTPTLIEPDQYNPWKNSANNLQAPEDGCINIRNMLSIK